MWFSSWFQPLLTTLLIGRSAISRDEPWKRVAGVVSAALPLFIGPMMQVLNIKYTLYGNAQIIVWALIGAFLIFWGYRSKDPRPVRLLTTILGFITLAPLAFLVAIAATFALT